MVEESQGKRLEYLRLKMRLTKYRLAQVSGVNRALITQAEKGTRKLSYNSAVKLAPYLNTTAVYLVDGTSEEELNREIKSSDSGEGEEELLNLIKKNITKLEDKIRERGTSYSAKSEA